MTPGIVNSTIQTDFLHPLPSETLDAEIVDRWLQQASDFLELNRYRDAIAFLDRILECKPDCFIAWYWRGNSLSSLGRYNAAIDSYEKALNLESNYFLTRLERQILLSLADSGTLLPPHHHR